MNLHRNFGVNVSINRKTRNPSFLLISTFPFQVVINKRLEVWTGSRATLTREYLLATDKDSGPAQLLYEVTKPTNGEIKLVDYPDSSVTNFTQEQIDEEKVVFVHTGKEYFAFQIIIEVMTNTAHRSAHIFN